MRRLVPFLIVAVGLLALAIDLSSAFPRPFGGTPGARRDAPRARPSGRPAGRVPGDRHRRIDAHHGRSWSTIAHDHREPRQRDRRRRADRADGRHGPHRGRAARCDRAAGDPAAHRRHRATRLRALAGGDLRQRDLERLETRPGTRRGHRPDPAATLQRRGDRSQRRRARRRSERPASASFTFTLKLQTAPSSSASYSSAHIGEYFAIVLDGNVRLGARHPAGHHRRQRADQRQLHDAEQVTPGHRRSSSARCRCELQEVSFN